jgi:hypothetical protein
VLGELNEIPSVLAREEKETIVVALYGSQIFATL